MSSIIALLAVVPLAAHAISGTGPSTRYWDCCKPSCAWPAKANVNEPVYTCDKNNNPLSNYNAVSGCESGGTAYTCASQEPWAVNSLVSYGFAATNLAGETEADWCCGCYALTFTSGKAKGKIMVVQSVNTGGDLGSNQFDLQIPGGGEGIFDGCSSQFGGIAGAQYGGISSRSQCSTMPAALQPGCDWRFDWFNNADNPTHTFTQVQCPAALTNITGCKRSDDASFPAFVMPSPATWNPPTPTATAAAYAQCDSLTYDVALACPAGFYCKYMTDYYWQCAQGTAPSSSAPALPSPSSPSSSKSVGGGSSSSSISTASSKSTTSVTLVPTPPAQTTAPAPTAAPTQGTQSKYGQCGGSGWTGATVCAAGSTCSANGAYYAQCL